MLTSGHTVKTCHPTRLLCPRPAGGHFGTARSVRLSVPWRSCLGYRHAGCLQLSHRLPSETCGLRTRPRTDVDKPRLRHRRTAIGGGHTVSPPPGRYLVLRTNSFYSAAECCDEHVCPYVGHMSVCEHISETTLPNATLNRVCLLPVAIAAGF